MKLQVYSHDYANIAVNSREFYSVLGRLRATVEHNKSAPKDLNAIKLHNTNPSSPPQKSNHPPRLARPDLGSDRLASPRRHSSRQISMDKENHIYRNSEWINRLSIDIHKLATYITDYTHQNRLLRLNQFSRQLLNTATELSNASFRLATHRLSKETAGIAISQAQYRLELDINYFTSNYYQSAPKGGRVRFDLDKIVDLLRSKVNLLRTYVLPELNHISRQ